MVRMGCGVVMLGLGGILLLWGGYNLLIDRQAEFNPNLGYVLFTTALLVFGFRWVNHIPAEPQRSRKKKKRRRKS